MDYAVFEKNMENVRKQGDFKVLISEKRRNDLVSEPNYHTANFFFRKFISNRNKKKLKHT